MKSLFFAMILTIASITSAYAERGTPSQIFIPKAKKHIEMVLDKGVVNIKSINLKKLLAEMDNVDWRVFELGFLMGSGGNRQSSIYIVKDKMVVINMYTLQNMVGKPVPVYSWALHESLGALGYHDENYELSSSISFIANSSDEDLETNLQSIGENFVSVEKVSTDRIYAMSGGSTVIGGGGDMALVELKQKILERFRKWMDARELVLSKKQISKAIVQITKMNIEYDFPAQKHNSWDFRYDGKMILVDIGAEGDPAKMYTDEYVYSILDTLQESLLK